MKRNKTRYNEGINSHWTASNKSKMHDQFRDVDEWNISHPEITCDRCGFTSRYEDFFDVDGDEILCDKCRRGMNEDTIEERAYLRSIGEYDGYLGNKKKPAKRKWGGASKKSSRKTIRRPVAKKEYKYSFSASGYGTKTYSFPSEEECLKEMKQDAEATALDYGGEVQWWDDKECVVVDGDGQELGSFEYIGAR